MDAFRDHGKPRAAADRGCSTARATFWPRPSGLASIWTASPTAWSPTACALFADASDDLLGAVAAQARRRCSASRLLQLGVRAAGRRWSKQSRRPASDGGDDGKVRRLWAHDASLWTGGTRPSGWLARHRRRPAAPRRGAARPSSTRSRRGFSRCVAARHGRLEPGPGSARPHLRRAPAAARLHVLDSTDPQQIATFENALDLAKTLFIVSSKSGSTLEPNILKAYFFEQVRQAVGAEAGRQRISSPSPTPARTCKKSPRRTFPAVSSLAIRPSAAAFRSCRNFGLVPAAAIGHRFSRASCTRRSHGALLRRRRAAGAQSRRAARHRARRCAAGAGATSHHRRVARHRRFRRLAGTAHRGKHRQARPRPHSDRRRGAGAPAVYGKDRSSPICARRRAGRGAGRRGRRAGEGRPAGRAIDWPTTAVGQQFFLWEFATAVAGSMIGINPFDQPDVEASKIKTRELTDAFEKTGTLPAEARTQPRLAWRPSAEAAGRQPRCRDPRPCAGLAGRLRRAARLYRAERRTCGTEDCAWWSATHTWRPRRVRAALPALHRPGLQRRAEQRRVPADHRRRRARPAGARASATASAWSRRRRRAAISSAGERGRRALRVHIGFGRRSRTGPHRGGDHAGAGLSDGERPSAGDGR